LTIGAFVLTNSIRAKWTPKLSPISCVIYSVCIIGTSGSTGNSLIISPEVLWAIETANSFPCSDIQGVPSKLAERHTLFSDVICVKKSGSWANIDALMSIIVSVVAIGTIQSIHAKVLLIIAIQIQRTNRTCR
jgi:hypothetical protein